MKQPFGALRTVAVGSIALILLLAACGGPAESDIAISDAWVRAAGAMPDSADDTSMDMPQEAGDDASASDEQSEAGQDMNAPPGEVSAAYMVIENRGAADRLLSAATDAAGVVEIHMTQVDEQGVMRMRPLAEGLEVPANSSVALEPGGYHIMLMDLQRALAAGDTVELTLQFESGKAITISAEVRAP
mgnify:CR=1 FL=1